VLELGSDRGVSTEVFLNRCDARHGRRSVGLHPAPELSGDWDRSLASAAPRYDAFMHRCGQYPNLTTIRGFGEDEMPKMADQSFDMVYIDAVHIYQPFIDDVHASFRLVKDSGWIAGHDFYRPDNETNIIKAVTEIFGAPLQVFSDSSWIVRKPVVSPEYARADQALTTDRSHVPRHL
jgi:predicted O-methyltransferase YrrM